MTTVRMRVVACVLLGVASIASAGTYDLSWFTIDGGGGTSVDGLLALSGTIGQPDANPDVPALTGGGYKLTGGFWAGAAPPAPEPCGDFDGDGDIDLADFAVFGQCFGGSLNPPSASCPAGVDADCDGDGDVDLSDFAIFSQNFTGSM
jgi:hypothetical protein